MIKARLISIKKFDSSPTQIMRDQKEKENIENRDFLLKEFYCFSANLKRNFYRSPTQCHFQIILNKCQSAVFIYNLEKIQPDLSSTEAPIEMRGKAQSIVSPGITAASRSLIGSIRDRHI